VALVALLAPAIVALVALLAPAIVALAPNRAKLVEFVKGGEVIVRTKADPIWAETESTSGPCKEFIVIKNKKRKVNPTIAFLREVIL
jgi:hypothetical protein